MVQNRPKTIFCKFIRLWKCFSERLKFALFGALCPLGIFHYDLGARIGQNQNFRFRNFTFAKNLSPPSKSVGNRYKSSFSGFGTFLRACMLRFWKNSFLTILHWICQMSKKRRNSKNFCCNPRQKNRKSENFQKKNSLRQKPFFSFKIGRKRV